MTVQKQILLAMTCLVALITGGGSTAFFLMQRHSLLDGIDEKLRASAIMARATLPPDYHDRITGPASVSDAQFLNIVDRYNQLCRELDLEYLWSLMLVNGRIVFTTSTSPDKVAQNRKQANFFEEHSNPESYRPTFARMTPTYQINDDKWGRIRVALIPFRDSQGRPYLFGASVRLTRVDQQLRWLIYQCLAVSLVLFTISVILSFLLARAVARPIHRLTDTIQGITNGEDERVAEERGGFEQVVLARSFNQMRQALRLAHDELEQRVQERTLDLARSNEALQREIAERTRIETALRESEARLNATIESLPFDFWFMDASRRYLIQNSISCGKWGCHVGRSLDEVGLPAEILDRWRENDRQAFSGEIVTGEFECQEGEERRVYYNVIGPVRLEDQIIGILGVNIDITARRRAEEALLAANAQLADGDRRKDEFLAMLAHELRNPLAPIRNAVHLLRQSDLEPDVLLRQHDIIERQVVHMARLLDDLLDVSRITHGKIELKREPVALGAVLSQAVETAMPLIQARRHTLEFTPPPDALHVEADLDRLAQAVGNLLSNAAKYTEAGGRIRLAAGREDGQVAIRVRDTGLGIAPETMTFIFDLFAQAERSLDRAQGGLGIGLTLARNLVQMHEGTLQAHSAGLGLGSEFTIRLPAWSGDPPQDQPPAEPAAPPDEVARRVLVVDDVADTAESMVELLESWGHAARAAYDGSSALEAVRGFAPDTVLLDIGLPGMNGHEVARRLREEHGASLLLVALTGYGQESDREQACRAGFDHHMTKPVDLRALAALLQNRPAPSNDD